MSIYNISKSYYLQSKTGDIFGTFHNSKKFLDVLLNKGYKETTNFFEDKFNIIYNTEEIKYYKKNNSFFKTEIELTNNNGITNIYSYFNEENYIIFYSQQNFSTDFYFNLDNNYILKDFKIDKNNYIYLIYSYNNEDYILVSHLSAPFLEINKNNDSINFEYAIMNIKLPKGIKKIVKIEDSIFYFSNINNNIYKIEFEKLYFFINNNKIYFNMPELLSEYKESFLGIEQIENLYMYNNLNIYGLNEFKVDNKYKISSLQLNLFNELFINKFDNTLNGGINFFNAKSYGLSNLIINNNALTRKDYSLNYNSEQLNISGNFYLENSDKGKYKIIIYKNKINLYILEYDKWKFIKGINYSNNKELYFCNLKIVFKTNYIDDNFHSEIEFSNYDEYPFEMGPKICKITSVPNNNSSIQQIIDSSDFSDKEVEVSNCYFDGKSVIFNNFYDFKRQSFLYGNISINATTNNSISLNDISLYYFDKSYQIKNEKIYFRNNGIFNYTKIDKIKFELINEKNYITDFWIKNQGKTIYFKNINNGVLETNYSLNADYKINIPFINDYINYSDKQYSNIYIEDSDDLSIERDFSDDILITDKFLIEPLFYKFYLPYNNLESFKLYDNNNNDILYLSKPFKDGYIIYFNKYNNKKYFYNIENEKYKYLEPIKSYENIEINYYFDDNNIINFSSLQKIESFKLKSSAYINGNINIYLYNTIQGLTYRIQITSNELNTKFDLGIEVDKIYIETTENNHTGFIFIEESGDSIVSNDRITFFKEKREDTIYISHIVPDINLNNLDFSKIKINTKYLLKNNKIIISDEGNFYINSPFKDSIPIYLIHNTKEYFSKLFITTMSHDDQFYIENFKSPGNYYQYKNKIIKDLSNSTNNIFTIEEVNNER